MEASRTFSSEKQTKWLKDYQKVAKALHDMLFRLQSAVKQEPSLLEKIQVAGLVSAGLDCQVLRMSYAGGHVCILSRDKRYRVPAEVTESAELLHLLFSIWRMKMIIRNSKSIVDGCQKDYTEADAFAKLMESPNSSACYPKIPRTFDTEDDDEIE
ncbi:hypothetical protein L873DRAFT_1820248 [Choiromyces venosus 120613-1]|uniref:Uncharacterized protein n=1 Tax=Choiromyces venosus 120613-1 TaxID=1336337 RepID=A0A3N4IXM9_9PEZI|nr:hypothetical protein L873DRAFT_1820248 [Choiromyces venosus 120613-1]